VSDFDKVTPSPIDGREGWNLFSIEPNGPSKIVRTRLFRGICARSVAARSTFTHTDRKGATSC
jgi:hypothetical protein